MPVPMLYQSKKWVHNPGKANDNLGNRLRYKSHASVCRSSGLDQARFLQMELHWPLHAKYLESTKIEYLKAPILIQYLIYNVVSCLAIEL